MSYSSHTKMLKQLEVKPAKKQKYLKHCAPKDRSCGISRFKCRRCGTPRAFNKKYGLNLCRKCFREIATKIGFKKYG